MRVAHQPEGQRKSAANFFKRVVHRGNVVRDFLYVIDGYARGFFGFKQQKIGE